MRLRAAAAAAPRKPARLAWLVVHSYPLSPLPPSLQVLIYLASPSASYQFMELVEVRAALRCARAVPAAPAALWWGNDSAASALAVRGP